MSIVRICANWAIAVRYADTDASVDARVSAFENPLLRAAIVKLAAIRFTSYSNGPGSNAAKLGTAPRRCGSSGYRCGVEFGRFLV
jgi:hypothetical protein